MKNLISIFSIVAIVASSLVLTGFTSHSRKGPSVSETFESTMNYLMLASENGAGCPHGQGWERTLSSSETKVGCCGLFNWFKKVDITRQKYNCYAECPAYGGGPCYSIWEEVEHGFCKGWEGC